jgi:hypothetical protein
MDFERSYGAENGRLRMEDRFSILDLLSSTLGCEWVVGF